MNRLAVFRYYVDMVYKVFKLCPQYVVCSVFTSFIASILSLVNIFFEKQLINEIASYTSFFNIILILGLIIVFPLLVSIPDIIISNCLMPKYTQRVTYSLQKELFQKSFAVSLASFDDSSFYDNYTIAIQQATRRAFGAIATLSTILSAMLSIVILVGVVATVDPILIIIALFSAITSLVSSTITSKVSLRYVDKCIKDDRKSSYISRIFYLVDYAKEIRMHNGPSLFLPKYKKSIQNLEKLFIARGKEISVIQLVASLATNIFSFILLCLLSYRAFILKLSIGGVIALINSSQQLKGNIFSITNAIQSMYEHSLYIQKYQNFLKTPDQQNSGQLSIPDIQQMTINDISYSYQNSNNLVLSKVSMKIKRGELVALVGKNGSGKSTFAKIIARLYEPTSGEILLDNINYLHFDLDSYRTNVFCFFQDYKCFSLSVAENVLMRPCITEDDEKLVFSALKYAGLLEKIQHSQSGIHSIINREFDSDGIVLSGGEIQKLSIARMYACQSKIIILDEPTSALDSASRLFFIKSLKQLPQNPIVILISHTVDDVCDADRIYTLEHGQIIASGSFDELCSASPLCV